MTGPAVLSMIVFLGITWGGFAALLLLALRGEARKGARGGGGTDPQASRGD